MKALDPENIELIEQYAKGQVTDKEARYVQELLNDRPECREYHDFIVHFHKTLEKEAMEPPVWLKRKILTQLGESKKQVLVLKWAPLAAMILLALLVGTLIGGHLRDIQTALSHMNFGGLAIFNVK